MKKLLKIKIALFAFVLIGLIACNSSSKELGKGLINPPIPELAKAYTTFEIDPSKDQELKIPSGTVIKLKANSLVDASGNIITGKATIQYREYHDAVDVLLSGIPMDYDADGTRKNMQTAGMFDINGEQNGQAVFVKEGAGIQVDFASFEEGTDYNFFRLNQEKGWQFLDYVAPKVNEERLKTAQEITKLESSLKTKIEPYFVFNYNAVLDVEYDNNWSKIDANKNNKSLFAKVKRYDLEYFKSGFYTVIKYKGNQYPADMMVWKNRGKRFPNWVRNEDCNIVLKGNSGNVYTVEAQKDDKTYTAKIEAIAPLKYMFQYSPEDWKKNFQKVMKEISEKEEKLRIELEEARKRYEEQAAMIRSFQVAGFGVYNYDKLMKEEDRIEVLAEFNMENTPNLDWVICLPEDGKTVISYPKDTWDKVVLLPKNAAKFITILSDKTIGIFAVKDYQALKFEELKAKSTKPTCEFKLVKVLDKASSEEVIRQALNS